MGTDISYAEVKTYLPYLLRWLHVADVVRRGKVALSLDAS